MIELARSLTRPRSLRASRSLVAAVALVALGAGAAPAQNRSAGPRLSPKTDTPVVETPVYVNPVDPYSVDKTDVLDACTPGNIWLDGSFEATSSSTLQNPNYTLASTQFGSPLCDFGNCGNGGGVSTPRTGSFWAWFGGVSGSTAEVGSAAQTVTFPMGATSVTLNYYLKISTVTSPFTDTLVVQVDGVTQQTWTEPSTAETSYTLRTLDLTSFANGAPHTVKFLYTKGASGGTGSFNVDDISLDVVCAAAVNNKDSAGIYVASTGTFFLRNQNSAGGADIAVSYGAANATPLTGDWNGDGTDTIGIYDTNTGAFFLKNANTPGAADLTFVFGGGGAGIVPLSGDWDGNGTDTIGIYNTTTGTFFLRNSNDAGGADITVAFGAGGAGIYPIVGDWNNDGTDTIGLYNQNTGTFFIKNSNTPGGADTTYTFGAPAAGYLPIVGDWDNNGTDTVGIYNPSTAGFFLSNTMVGGGADISFVYGPAGQIPLAGDWDNLP